MAIDNVFITLSTLKLLALTAYAEARSDGIPGMQAVLEVVRNRAMKSEVFADQGILALTGDVYKAVILKPYQFSPYNQSDNQYNVIKNMAENFDRFLHNDDELYAAYTLAGQINSLDSVGSATYFHAVYIIPPSWTASIPYITTIGHHIFYGEPLIQMVKDTVKKTAPWLTSLLVLSFLILLNKKNNKLI